MVSQMRHLSKFTRALVLRNTCDEKLKGEKKHRFQAMNLERFGDLVRLTTECARLSYGWADNDKEIKIDLLQNMFESSGGNGEKWGGISWILTEVLSEDIYSG